jgi:hypothetical protein
VFTHVRCNLQPVKWHEALTSVPVVGQSRVSGNLQFHYNLAKGRATACTKQQEIVNEVFAQKRNEKAGG